MNNSSDCLWSACVNNIKIRLITSISSPSLFPTFNVSFASVCVVSSNFWSQRSETYQQPNFSRPWAWKSPQEILCGVALNTKLNSKQCWALGRMLGLFALMMCRPHNGCNLFFSLELVTNTLFGILSAHMAVVFTSPLQSPPEEPAIPASSSCQTTKPITSTKFVTLSKPSQNRASTSNVFCLFLVIMIFFHSAQPSSSFLFKETMSEYMLFVAGNLCEFSYYSLLKVKVLLLFSTIVLQWSPVVLLRRRLTLLNQQSNRYLSS